ncbi:MAG: sigma-70 family RNA polymerase sigma factor [Muribaculaceae bacterium]|nr:sigma-70 family RNA polymerase sigma factor [Muribaculaceae bacterium]
MECPPTTRKEFDSFVRTHSRIINKVCWAYATPKVPYEDLRQEILTNLWLGLDQFRGISKLSTWVYRVAVNSALMAIRNYKPKLETLPFEISGMDISSESDDERTERLEALYELISQLLPIEKAIILLWLDEYSYEEIAEIIGINRNNVAIKLHRIKNNLISKSK